VKSHKVEPAVHVLRGGGVTPLISDVNAGASVQFHTTPTLTLC
jgi:hypothetical protein